MYASTKGYYTVLFNKGVRGKLMPKVKASECTACGLCADVCPQDAITVNDVAVIDQDACVDCGACVDECPSGAIE